MICRSSSLRHSVAQCWALALNWHSVYRMEKLRGEMLPNSIQEAMLVLRSYHCIYVPTVIHLAGNEKERDRKVRGHDINEYF